MNAVEELCAEIIRLILTMTITGSVMSVFLFVVRPMVKDRLPKTFLYYMWFPVLVALLLPLSGISAPPAWGRQAAPVGAAHELAQWITDTAFERPANAGSAPMQGNGQEIMRTAVQAPGAAAVLFVIWLSGMLLVFGYHVTGYGRYVRKIRRYNRSADQQETALTHMLAGGRHTPRLYHNAFAVTPVLIGVLQPEIILPDKEYGDSEMQSVLLHELTHMRRHDIAVKWLLVFAGALHWFNPVVHYACREINKACELACDESVIGEFDNIRKQQYGDALIAAAADTVRGIPASITMFEDKKNLKERLEAIMKYREFSGKTIFISGVLLGIIMCAVLCLGVTRVSADTENRSAVTYTAADPSPMQRQRHEKELEVQNINLDCMDMETFTTLPQDYFIDADHTDSDSGKDQAYLDYLGKVMTETIEEMDGVAGCKIDIDYSAGKIASARVSITVEDRETGISETDILDYISHALDVPEEDVVLSVD